MARFFVLAALCLNVTGAVAGGTYDFSGLSVVKLSLGVNRVRLGGDTSIATVVIGHRENFNAHGFDVATIYLDAKTRADDARPTFQIVPLWDEDSQDKETLRIDVSGGADCVLDDFRLLRTSATRPPVVVLAHRPVGESYADKNAVTFRVYELTRAKPDDVGWPLYRFARVATLTAGDRYCDVGDAFSRELQLGDYRAR